MNKESHDVSFSYFNNLQELDLNKCLKRKRFRFIEDSLNKSPPICVTPSYFQIFEFINIEEVTINKKLLIRDIFTKKSCSLSSSEEKIEIETLDDIELYKHNIKKPKYIDEEHEKYINSKKPLPKFLSGKNLIDNAIKMANNLKSCPKRPDKIVKNNGLDFVLDELLKSSSK